MKPTAYFDAVKAELNIQSDYELAKRLEFSNKTLPDMRKGERAVPLDVAFRIAITLQLDPAEVVADLAEQREKNETRRAFWRGFLSRAATVLIALACTLVWSFSAISEAGAVRLGGSFGRRRQYA